uniref:Uncharacterized protein n=1 Tax=Knipowitschia caucasica TaxID=637954 RepID=A0AAV2LQ91_KNICA
MVVGIWGGRVFMVFCCIVFGGLGWECGWGGCLGLGWDGLEWFGVGGWDGCFGGLVWGGYDGGWVEGGVGVSGGGCGWGVDCGIWLFWVLGWGGWGRGLFGGGGC